MEGFFSLSTITSKSPLPLLPRCGQCGLYKTCKSPKMPPSGKGRKRILLLGESPGETEDEQGIQFIGKTGSYLQRVLSKIGVDMRKDCWITNSIICRPPKNILPKPAIAHCQPNLTKTLKQFDPDVIIPLGGPAVQSLLSLVWKEEVGPIGRWAGFCIPCQEPNAWICPTYHPSYVCRMLDQRDEVTARFFERHLQIAVGKEGKPWDTIEDPGDKVKRILDSDEAVKWIEYLTGEDPVAWDLETSYLKPDHPKARIVCCSMSDGDTTIAYPWDGKAIEATKKFLLSDTPKMGWNCKFEERWCRAKLGLVVNNWIWDGMVNQHILDNRPGICRLKFQAFVRRGQPDYEAHIAPYLKSSGSNTENRIKDIDILDLLRYCGMDSYLEHEIGMQQMKEMGFDWRQQ
jgi:uracil-DNA glycosylase